MLDNVSSKLEMFYNQNITAYFADVLSSPLKIILLIVDIVIVIFLIVKMFQLLKNTRTWQLIKGIIFLIIATIISGKLGLQILNFILTSIMTYGVFVLIVIFQPELRRALEQIGTRSVNKFFGIQKDIVVKTKENIYKVVVAVMELSKLKVGALIVLERDIKVKDIIENGIAIDSEVSPQLLVNIFTPKTPLHDGAVVISNNKIAAAACMLPLADDMSISKELGTRHRAAIGMSKESDALVVVISEETGRISIAKDSKLIADVSEETLKRILIKNLVVTQFEEEKQHAREKIGKLKGKFRKGTTNK